MAKILIADDDLEIQELIRFTLENEGHEVRVASDGAEALAKVEEERPDLVLLDVMMPKCTGFEVCEKLRGNPATCLLPIVLLTSLVQPKDRITGIKLGADEYLCKPFEPMELTVRIEAMMRRIKVDVPINPLTGLPGNNSIQGELEARLKGRDDFALLYIDIDKFKSYNDSCGFPRGDDVLRYMAAILRSGVGEIGTENTFIGHIGGDDFVVIAPAGKAETLAKRIIESFNSLISTKYDEETYKRGYVSLVDETGKQNIFPLISVSIGIIVVHPELFRHYSEALERAKEKWRSAKLKPGSAYSY